MFRAGHKERCKRLTVITRFRGSANRKECRNWKVVGEQGRSWQAPTVSFSLSVLALFPNHTGSRRFRAVTIARLPRLIHLTSHNPSFPSRSLDTGVPAVLINENPLTIWHRFPFLFFVSVNGMTVSHR